MSERRIVIAGTGSGVGKTTVTIGLMAALKRRGMVVQGFKCGPDYIDPTYHTAVTGRTSRNLDSWMLPHEVVKEIYARGSAGADISIIEGVMGFYDGKEATSDRGSTAEISLLTRSPVLLVVNCQSMARSAAAIVKGFQLLNPDVRIVAVLANKVGSEGHYCLVKQAVEQECEVPVIGYLQREEQVEIPERHLGLVPSVERGELQPLFDRLAELITRTVDLDQLLDAARAEPLLVEPVLFTKEQQPKRVRIAVAKDAAFHFYYPENLELLEAHGAECVFFSPLAGEAVPDGVDGLYIGGGFPEEFARELSGNRQVMDSVRLAIQSGLPTLAECGGFMYLTEELVTTEGKVYPMVGIIPGRITMQKRLAALGYREVRGVQPNFLLEAGELAKGHEFRYSTYAPPAGEVPYAYETKGLRGMKQEGYARDNLVAGYTHLHFASNPMIVTRWIERCLGEASDG
ncbi:cobyrinate a,c-diamide synthase [Brevibacillus humidisoli]|uniref:cobyrinate a,c-diamide synthase n=1 Tax=Brevibacillus humidisoli TaxID=2895522 RepID=UPI001E4C294C|nr:cobyrinate a,c-diamide synthase [Brevibacillus humidisoli]UFJ41481.1 cobyrinate a,c-diamide synthase [Brevibacillus humidisoli]